MTTNASFFERLDQVKRAIAEPADHRNAVQDLEPLLDDPDVRREFYSLLESPAWIVPLQEGGHFDVPPGAEPTSGGDIHYPQWPASRYLARVSAKAPAEVARIFAKIETDNVSIIRDMVAAALAMPADVASSLVPAISRPASEGILWSYLTDASDLCVRLAEGGEPDAAMTLTEALFAPAFEVGQEEPGRQHEYWYKEGLKKATPVLSRTKAREFLPKLCDWLKASVESKKHVDPDSGSDYSYMWRPAIEEHEQNRDYDFAGAMVGLVREGFEEAIRNESLSLEDALQIVDRYSFRVFKRIRLHLIGEFADQNLELARETILNREFFDNYEYKHEFATLVGRRLDLLLPQQRDEWFGWIDAGPDMSGFDESARSALSREPTDQDRENRKHYWQYERLWWIRGHLGGRWKQLFDKMHAEHGEPELADLSVRIGDVHVGTESPMTVNDLAGKTFEEAVNAVSSWRPEKSRFMGPDIEGLAATFGQYLGANAEQFSAEAQLLIARPAIFVRRFIREMGKAAKAGREINLPAVLKLCHWVAGRPVEERTTPEQEHEGLVDKDWQWTRDEISQLVENVCTAKSGDGPRYPLAGLREPMWELIEGLCRDRAESYMVRDISADDPRVHDYLDLGINSPRGKAVEAALEYARWRATHIKKSDGQQDVIPGGLDAMPEVREMLQWQIAQENRSFEVMSVIGSRMSVIYWIDKKWLAPQVDRLFDLERIETDPARACGWAAWNAFLVYCPPHIEYFKLLEKQFKYAVHQHEKLAIEEVTHGSSVGRLGKHLIVLYGRGQLGLDDHDSPLRRFLSGSCQAVRSYAIRFVGRSLYPEEDKTRTPLPHEVIDRFVKLWEWYWPEVGSCDEEPSRDLFSYWYLCRCFPRRWALEQLSEYVQRVPLPEPDYGLPERLAEDAELDPERVLSITAKMIEADKEGWRVDTWEESIKPILASALKAGEPTRSQAVSLINRLGRKGWISLGELLRAT